jgi:hypothetical protein
VVEVLLAGGAVVKVKNNKGKFPIDLTSSTKCRQILKGVDRGKVDKSEPKRHTGKWMP